MSHDWDSSKKRDYVAYVSVGEDHKKWFGAMGNVDCEQFYQMGKNFFGGFFVMVNR
jgi:hypothetical protein